MDSLRPGKVLRNKFLIESVLGTGGMGTVYQALHIRMQTRVAIKVLNKEHASHQVNMGRFEREALAAARLRGSHAVRVYDVDTSESGSPFLVMELLRGRDLSAVLREQELPQETLIDYAIQICSAIHEAHQLGVVHRDLKPSNIFVLDGSNHVKIVDFGISKIHDGVELTADSEVLGTPRYMSPEQLRGEQVGPQTDVWAIGMILYRMLSNEHPFPVPPNSAAFVLAASTLTQEPVSIAEHCPDLPKGLVDAVMSCLEKSVEVRIKSVRELAELLKPFGTGTIEVEEVEPRPQGSDSLPSMLTWLDAEKVDGNDKLASSPPTAVEIPLSGSGSLDPDGHAELFRFAKDAEAGVESLSQTVVDDVAPPPPRQGLSRLVWATAMVVVIVVGGVAYALSTNEEPQPSVAATPPDNADAAVVASASAASPKATSDASVVAMPSKSSPSPSLSPSPSPSPSTPSTKPPTTNGTRVAPPKTTPPKVTAAPPKTTKKPPPKPPTTSDNPLYL